MKLSELCVQPEIKARKLTLICWLAGACLAAVMAWLSYHFIHTNTAQTSYQPAANDQVITGSIALPSYKIEALQQKISQMQTHINGLRSELHRASARISEMEQSFSQARVNHQPVVVAMQMTKNAAASSHGVPLFGVKIGTTNKLKDAYEIWEKSLKYFPDIFSKLEARVKISEDERYKTIIDVIAGPLTDAAQAASLCAKIIDKNGLCAPALFDGQKLMPPGK